MAYTTSPIYAIEPIISGLRTAREAKGFSQRALAEMTGIGQANISRIESSAQDLRLSSLVGLARALDLEFMLVPRTLVPGVTAFIRWDGAGSELARPAYQLDHDDGA